MLSNVYPEAGSPPNTNKKRDNDDKTTRGRHLRVRADAFSTAIYFGECSLNGISADGAAAAEEDARSRQSKWWLPGNDPNHPSQMPGSLHESIGGDGPSNALLDQAQEMVHETASCDGMNNDVDAHDNDGNDVDEHDQHDVVDEDQIIMPAGHDDSPGPVFARDDDLGANFGDMKNLLNPNGATASIVGADNVVPQRNSSSLLPSWLVGPHTAPNTASVSPDTNQSRLPVCNEAGRNFTEDIGSSEEMLQSVFSSPTNRFPCLKKGSETHQVTSESEADDSGFYSSAASCDGSSTMNSKRSASHYASSSIRNRHHALKKSLSISLPVQDHLEKRAKKRVRILIGNNGGSSLQHAFLDAQIKSAKADLLSRLEIDEGGTDSPFFSSALASLESMYQAKLKMKKEFEHNEHMIQEYRANSDNNVITPTSSTEHDNMDGTWMTISSMTYPSGLGTNTQGERLFNLGRMAFDIFKPKNLICSIQQQYNTIKTVERKEELPSYLPEYLRKEVDGSGRLKTYNIIASFTIEHPDNINEEINEEQSNLKKPLTGILTNYGYALPDPFVPDRKSIWFTGGTIEPADDDEDSIKEWKKIFVAHSIDNANTEEKEKVVDSPTAGDTKEAEAEEKKEVVDSPNDGDTKEESTATSAETEKARHLASKIFLGAVSEPMQDDGTIGFHLIRPIGGHGHAYCDLLYIDDEIRVMRGHSGSVYVLRKEVIGE